MRFSLSAKLFAALLSTACVSVSIIVIRAGWGLQSGYEEYANTAALANMDGLVHRLEDIYAATNSWSTLTAKPLLWTDLVRSAEEIGGPGDPGFRPPMDAPPVNAQGDGGPMVPAINAADRPAILGNQPSQEFVRYFALVDISHHALFGVPDSMPHAARRSLWLNGQRIGWLLFDPGPQAAGLQAGFLAERVRDLYLTGAAALLCSALVAVFLSRSILFPVRSVTRAARRLAAGDYATRIATRRGDELGDLVRDVNQLASALQTAEEAQRRWVTDTAHELRTPLTIMLARIEALQDEVYPFTLQELAVLRLQVQQLALLVGDLGELSRADAGVLSLHLQPIRPAEILADVLASCAPMRESRNIALDLPPIIAVAAHIRGDAERMRQVFTNVVKNAISYTDPGGVLRAGVRVADQSVLIEIEDSAPGVAAEDHERLFERFFRADQSRSRHTGGSGLGLAICRAIVGAHGGTIVAGHSSLGGIAITIALPLMGDA